MIEICTQECNSEYVSGVTKTHCAGVCKNICRGFWWRAKLDTLRWFLRPYQH